MIYRLKHIGAAFFAAFLILALGTYSPAECLFQSRCLKVAPYNLGGWLGAYLSHLLYQLLGIGAWLLPLMLLHYFIMAKKNTSRKHFFLGWMGMIAVFTISSDLIINPTLLSFGHLHAGGIFGAFLAYQGPWLLGQYGLVTALLTLFFISFYALSGQSLPHIFFSFLERSCIYTVKLLLSLWPAKKSSSPSKKEPQPVLEKILAAAPSKNLIATHSPFIDEMSQKIVTKLKEYGIFVKIQDIKAGPVLIRFECLLAAGERSQKIAALAQDLARGLKVERLGVVHNIPGKPTIAIEIPQPQRQKIAFEPVFAAIEKQSYLLPLALGVDSQGNPVICDLAALPHLLVAGATGSGKSVAMNVMLMSLMTHLKPEHLKCVLVDPKILEFALYQNRAHLAIPVVTEAQDALAVLEWCVDEMQKRYKILAQKGFQNIRDYHQSDKEARSAMPFWVIVVDELADLMLMTKKAVEEPIARLAQKARACGIHLILATQRPSVDVITGLIKANIPARLSFALSSKIDSRTILDSAGAEELLGYGDGYLLRPNGQSLLRIHGAFMNDSERKALIEEISPKIHHYPLSLQEIVQRYHPDRPDLTEEGYS